MSSTTVTRFLQGERVRAAGAVRRAIDDLDYRPTHAARSLRSGIQYTIGVVVPDISNPYFAAVVKGIESVFRPGPYSVLLSNTNESSETEESVLLDMVRRVDGIILVPATEREKIALHESMAKVPIVLVDRDLPGEFDRVLVDNHGGAAQAAKHLLDLGHREIAVVSGPLDTLPGRERHEGFLAELGRAGIEIPPAYCVFSDFRESGGYEAMLRLLALPEPPTAVFCANNLMTLGALKALHSMLVSVPGQLSVIGFDDLDTAPLLRAPLTVIDRPTVDQGVLAARLLFSRLTGQETTEFQRVVLPTHLIQRGSCAAPRFPSEPKTPAGSSNDGRPRRRTTATSELVRKEASS